MNNINWLGAQEVEDIISGKSIKKIKLHCNESRAECLVFYFEDGTALSMLGRTDTHGAYIGIIPTDIFCGLVE